MTETEKIIELLVENQTMIDFHKESEIRITRNPKSQVYELSILVHCSKKFVDNQGNLS